jgi:hypothetical protein
MSKAKHYNPPEIQSNMVKKGILLYLFLAPLFLSVVIALFKMKFFAFLLNSVDFLLFFIVIYLSKKGFAQEINYQKSRIAKAPRIRYKEFAAYLLGVTTFYSAYIAGKEPLMESLFLGALSIVGYWLFYGFDPRKDKLEDFGDISADVVLKTFHEAREKMEKIEKDSRKIEDRELKRKIDRAMDRADAILDAIAEDPRDIRAARKFLVVYIDGVAKVTGSYTAMEEKEIDTETRGRLLRLMDDVDTRFEKELKRLKANNQFDLDVHIDVLKEQIKH